MYRETVLPNNETTAKAAAFIDKFEHRVSACPPGVCPITVHRALLHTSHAQTCGKCVPCRDGLAEVEKYMTDILEGRGTAETYENMVALAQVIKDTADCAIGYEAAQAVLEGTEIFKEEYRSHIEKGKCQEDVSQKVPCISYCPAHVDVPGYIALIKEGDYAGAVNLIRKTNPFPTACAFICEHPCEERCRRNLLDSPINIRGLKKYAVDQVAADQVAAPRPVEATGKKIAVVGGGPAGLTTAYFLSLMGHKVVVFEEREELGGMLRYGIPNYRLPKQRLDEDIRTILATGNIEVKTGVAIAKDITVEALNGEYDAVYIAIGAQTGKDLRLEGVESKSVYSAVDMLGEIGRGNIPEYTGKKVVVIGGGNVAMDAARSAVRCGADEVTIVYRRRQEDMTALPSEVQGAIEEGVELMTMHAPDRIEANEQGEVTAFYAKPQSIGAFDRAGRPAPMDTDKPSAKVDCDIVLLAIGQDIVSGPFAEYGVHPKRGTFEADKYCRVKGYDKIFAGGDCVTGPATVIKAIGASRVAAVNIDEYLGYHHKLDCGVRVPAAEENNRTRYGRGQITERSARERKKDFDGIEKGFSYEEAMQECSRCLRCDRYGCGVLEGGRDE